MLKTITIIIFILFFSVINLNAYEHPVPKPEHEIIKGEGTAKTGKRSVITMKPGDVLRDKFIWATGYDYGITFTDEPGIRYIFNSVVTDADLDGIMVAGPGVMVVVMTSVISGNRGNGISVTDKAQVWVGSTHINFNSFDMKDKCYRYNLKLVESCKSGVLITKGGFFSIYNSTIEDNAFSGIYAVGDETMVYVTTTNILRNARGYSTKGGSKATFTFSKINSNGTGFNLEAKGPRLTVSYSDINNNLENAFNLRGRGAAKIGDSYINNQVIIENSNLVDNLMGIDVGSSNLKVKNLWIVSRGECSIIVGGSFSLGPSNVIIEETTITTAAGKFDLAVLQRDPDHKLQVINRVVVNNSVFDYKKIKFENPNELTIDGKSFPFPKRRGGRVLSKNEFNVTR